MSYYILNVFFLNNNNNTQKNATLYFLFRFFFIKLFIKLHLQQHKNYNKHTKYNENRKINKKALNTQNHQNQPTRENNSKLKTEEMKERIFGIIRGSFHFLVYFPKQFQFKITKIKQYLELYEDFLYSRILP